MTTRNTQHAQVLASIASQVVEAHRHEFDPRVREGLRAENRDRFEDRNKRIRSRAELAGHVDPSWHWTLREEYLA